MEWGCLTPCVPDVTERSSPRLRSRAARSGDTHIRLHPYRRRPSSPQHVSLLTLGDEADRKDRAAIATAVRPSPRLSGICNIKLSRRSFSSDLENTSAQPRSVCTTRRLNSFFRNASCTDSSLMLRCRTFPQPQTRADPLLPNYGTGCGDATVHNLAKQLACLDAKGSGPHDPVELSSHHCPAQPQFAWRHSRCPPRRPIVYDTHFRVSVSADRSVSVSASSISGVRWYSLQHVPGQAVKLRPMLAQQAWTCWT